MASKNATRRSWSMMKSRCDNPNFPKFHLWGGRGITYDPKWKQFKGFLEDMGERPEGMTLDRYPNKDGNYCKSNCRWATPRQQSCNLKNNHPVPGVRWMKSKDFTAGGCWRAHIKLDGKQCWLYNGPDFFEAVCARKSADLKYK